MQTWQFLSFLFNKDIKFKNLTFWIFYLYRCFETGRFETGRFETWLFVNLTFCKPDVLKPNVLKPDVLKPDVLKPDVLWVYQEYGFCTVTMRKHRKLLDVQDSCHVNHVKIRMECPHKAGMCDTFPLYVDIPKNIKEDDAKKLQPLDSCRHWSSYR
jgi:hypothetical protein